MRGRARTPSVSSQAAPAPSTRGVRVYVLGETRVRTVRWERATSPRRCRRAGSPGQLSCRLLRALAPHRHDRAKFLKPTDYSCQVETIITVRTSQHQEPSKLNRNKKNPFSKRRINQPHTGLPKIDFHH
jgi:hypothetical protein